MGDEPLAVRVRRAIDQLHEAGRQIGLERRLVRLVRQQREVAGCDVCALAITGLPAATAAAKSPPPRC